MDEIKIGHWVRRRDTHAHIVESLIADRVVTRCGRQMRKEAKAGPLFITTAAIRLCEACSR